MSKVICLNDENEEIKIEMLLTFDVDTINKRFVAYTIDDDERSSVQNVFISEIESSDDNPKVLPIKEEDKEIVLMSYNQIKKSMENVNL